MKNICIIPARGGSKRIPKKNIVDFCGKPLIAYSIENALNSSIFDEVFVSSDDEEILQISANFGAKSFKRDEFCDDYSSSLEALRYSIKGLLKQNFNFENVCLLYPSAPLINAEILKDAYESFLQSKALFLFAASEFDYPIQRAFSLDENSRVCMFDESFYNARSQDLTRAYHDAGAFYFASKDTWLKENFIFKKHSTVYILARNLSCDIDTKEDLEFAKMLYKINQNKG